MAVKNIELEAIAFLLHNPSVAHPKPTGKWGGGGGGGCSSSTAFGLFQKISQGLGPLS